MRNGGTPFRWVCILLAAFLSGCTGKARSSATMRPHPAPKAARFVRTTEQAGIDFEHTDGSSGKKYFPEVMGPGCAFADFTGDGRPDVFLVNGAPLPGLSLGTPIRDRLYRNEGQGKFTDITSAAGVGSTRYGIGCCAGDWDNDGDLDLYVTQLDRNTLYRNNGNGTFTDVTDAAGVGAGGFSSAAAFADYNGDGLLDLYVCRYVRWTPERDVPCTANDGTREVRVYCRPSVYPALPDILYRNNGDGTFTDVTRQAGLSVTPGRGLGCLWSDVDADGDPDLFVANDMTANFLFINQGNGTFREEGLERGVALGEGGRPQASMGIAGADVDGDGHLDLACTNFSGEYLALYRNLGTGHFEDISARAGLVEATSPYVGFGLGFPDIDLDGSPDLFVANGHVTEAAEHFYPGVTFAQPALFLRGDGAGGFAPDSAAGEDVARPRIGRGVAVADYDGDGDLDVLVANCRATPDLLRNEGLPRANWLRLRLVGRTANRSAIGARVEVVAEGKTQVQEVRSGGSYCSQGELPLTFGLDRRSQAETVRVHWPGGKAETLKNLSAGKEHQILQR